MKMIRGTLKLALVLYICAALSGVYVLSASAKITPHAGDDSTTLVTVVKGDTLWSLAEEHLKDPHRWSELKQYNDFTNPHLIFPGEELRIPVAMAKEVVQMAEENLAGQQAELEQLKMELADSEATRDKLEAEITGLNDSMGELKGQIDALEGSLKSQEKLMDAVGDSVGTVSSSIKDALAAQKSAIHDGLAHLDEHIEEVAAMLEASHAKAEETQELAGAVKEKVKAALAQIEANQKAIAEVKMLIEDAKGVHEELSKSKRTLVFLTTLAAGVGLVVLNGIGGRSGE